MDAKRLATFIRTQEGSIIVTPDVAGLTGVAVNIQNAYTQTFLTPSEASQFIEALQAALRVVTP